MANRNWASNRLYSMHAMPVMLTATAQIGAAGAVSSFVGSAIASVAHSSTGIYVITAQPNTSFSRLFFAAGSCQSPVSGLSGVSTVEIQYNPNSTVQNLSTNQMVLTVKCLDHTGALVDPASGAALNVLAILSNSSIVVDGE